MKKNLWITLLGLLVALAFAFQLFLFIIHEGESAVLTTFGKPVRAITASGLYKRWPWPIQRVYRFDNRIHCLDGSFEQALTQDGKSVIVSVYAGWKIRDPMVFLERVGSITEAEQNLNGLLSNYKNAVVGQYLFSQLINTDTNILRFDQIEAEMLNAVRPVSAQRYGIDTLFVGIRRLSLPSAITEKVFQRMRAEREETAEKYRAEGEGEAIRIRAEADSDRDRILAAAEAQAKRIRAEGDAQAAEFYKTFEKNPDLAMFLRKLEVFEKTLQKRATVVLGPDTEPYDLLRGSEALPLKK